MRRLLSSVPALALCTMALAACGSSSSSGSGSSSSPPTTSSSTSGGVPPATSTATAAPSQPGPEGIPLEQGAQLAPASTTTPGTTVHGVQCAPVEQLAYHIHAHLQVYVDGQPRALPGAIGILGPVAQQTPRGPFYGGTQCYYWLHTHTYDGIIHIESPTQRIYTLGDFFDEWRQPLSAGNVAGATGKVKAYLNGANWTKSLRAIPLLPHAVIQLDVGSPAVPFHSVSFAGTGL